MRTPHLRKILGLFGAVAAVSAVGLAALVPAAGATTSATATLNAGSFGLLTVPAVSFSDTLNGANQTATTSQAIDVGDATGSGAGWNITATSTTFSTAGNAHSLATGATTIASGGMSGPTCDGGNTCTVATNSITYPYTLPAASTAPTATKMFNAALNTGMGNQTITPTWTLAIPANTYAGTYNSTWTLSLVSAP